jgi:hypothetical protein
MRLLRVLALTGFSFVLVTPVAFARGPLAVPHRASYQYYRDYDGATSGHRDAVSLRRRFTLRQRPNAYAFAPWQQQQDFGDFHSVDDDSKTYSARFGGPSFGGRYAQRWNGAPAAGAGFGEQSQLHSMAEQAASANGIPVSLVERVISRESGGNSRAVSRGNYGLMQIRLGTARAMGYAGSAQGLLDPATNVTYAVRYLAGAYRAAGGNESRAVALYARGYNATPRLQDAAY